MKDIKVRVWDKEAEEMIYSDNCPDDYFFEFMDGKLKAFAIVEKSATYDEPAHPESREIDCEPMLFIGRKDKNGKELYEGDIVIEIGIVNVRSEVIWHEEIAGFEFATLPRDFSERESWMPYFDRIAYGWERVGNIYENSELLNSQ